LNEPGPRSFGREEFGAAFGEKFLGLCRKQQLSNHDIMATASMFTIVGVQHCAAVNRLKFDRLLLTGGGARNQYLVASLKNNFKPIECLFVDSLGYPADYLEAISFAVLANEAINSSRHDLSAITGAKKSVVLGKICQA
jgi:anhydro-N-acetylmuramic acid kinase